MADSIVPHFTNDDGVPAISWTLPSPQSTRRLRTALPPVGTVTAKVNDAGSPALGGVLGGVITSVGCSVTLTVSDAVGAGVVVVPLTVAEPAVAVIFAPLRQTAPSTAPAAPR